MPGESPPSMPIKETPRRRSSTVPPNAPSSSPPRRTLSARKAQPPREPADPRMDNVFSWSASSRTRFVELAALQSLVSRTPSDPAAQASKLKSWEHDADKHAAAGWRVLPSKVERDTADNFAFLAAADAGAEFVSAVCVEERSAGGLAFRLAMNEGAMNEGVPQRIVDGLNRLCKTLENAAANGKNEPKLRHDAWQCVLDLETLKIVKDLKVKFNRQFNPLHAMFREALVQKRRLSALGDSDLSLQSTLTAQSTASVMDPVSLLRKIYDQCQDVANTEGSGREEVERLLDTCYLARKSKSFRTLVTTIDVQKALVQTIEKLGRYKAATYSLVSSATKYPAAFKVLEVLTVAPPVRESFALPEHPDTGLATLAAELLARPLDEAKLNLKRRTGLSETGLLRKYEELYLGRPHIHAEIQLVKYYEEHPPAGAAVNAPTFIGASKKTCHLCAKFLELHGRFAVSKTSATLHPRWTLPSMVCGSAAEVARCQDVAKQMTSQLEASCAAALSAPIPAPPRRPRTASVASASSRTATPTATQQQQPPPPPPLSPLTPLSPPVPHSPLSTVSIISTGKENALSSSPAPAPAPAPALAIAKPPALPKLPTAPSPLLLPSRIIFPDMQTTLSQKSSISKVRDWAISPHMAERIPLPPSARSSRVSTPAPRVLMPGFRMPLTPPEDFGGVPLSPTSLRPASRYVDAAISAPGSLRSRGSKSSVESEASNQRSRKRERHRERHIGLPTPDTSPVANKPSTPLPLRTSKDLGLPTPDATPTSPVSAPASLLSHKALASPSPGVASLEVQVSKRQSPHPAPPSPRSSPQRERERVSISTDTSTPFSAKSATSATTATFATSASPSATSASASASLKDKYHSMPPPVPPPPPRSPLGALNLTIERHSHDSSPSQETGYTIYLAGNYSESLSIGDAVFSGKLSDLNRKGEMIQCRGFRLRTGLRKRRPQSLITVKKEVPLKVHEVVKTSEMMVLDIIFPDAVVRMEVFWDEEARSVVSAAA